MVAGCSAASRRQGLGQDGNNVLAALALRHGQGRLAVGVHRAGGCACGGAARGCTAPVDGGTGRLLVYSLTASHFHKTHASRTHAQVPSPNGRRHASTAGLAGTLPPPQGGGPMLHACMSRPAGPRPTCGQQLAHDGRPALLARNVKGRLAAACSARQRGQGAWIQGAWILLPEAN